MFNGIVVAGDGSFSIAAILQKEGPSCLGENISHMDLGLQQEKERQEL